MPKRSPSSSSDQMRTRLAIRETARALDISPSRLSQVMGLTPNTVLGWMSGSIRIGHPVVMWFCLSDIRRRADAGDETIPVGPRISELREYEKRIKKSLESPPLTIDEHERFDEVKADPDGIKHRIPSAGSNRPPPPPALTEEDFHPPPPEESSFEEHINRPDPEFLGRTTIQGPQRTRAAKAMREKAAKR